MKITDMGITKFQGDCITIPIILKNPEGKGKSILHWFRTGLGLNEWEKQKSEPIDLDITDTNSSKSFWIFRDCVILVEAGEARTDDAKRLLSNISCLERRNISQE